MSSRLADRLSLARHRRFAGREAERALFQATLTTAELPFYVLYLFGPGGIGKTSLIKEFAYLADEAKIPVLQLDARSIEPAPEAFLTALQAAMGLIPP
jgi:Ni2+-binding GTPase involved in maturation of urease and hydrogenase